MIGVGAFAFTSKGLKELNLAVRERVWESRNNGNGRLLHIDDFTSVAPAIAVYGLNLAGVKGKNNLLDRSMMLSMSYLIGHTLIVQPIKKLSKVIRPDSSNYLSFPSGHTAQAFISAEFMRQEYKHLSPWYGIAGYTAAIGTGFLRMYNNKHWFNDVIAGAGVGILSTRISYWLYPKIKNSFLKKFKGNTVVAPTYNSGSFGIGVVHTFR
jgi:membrane-associated phospholipid phosphatase